MTAGSCLLAAGVCFLAGAVWLLTVSLGYRAGSVERAEAELIRTEWIKQKRLRDRRGASLSPYRRGTYRYDAAGDRQEKILELYTDDRQFPASLTVVYQRRHPKRAWFEGVTRPMEPWFCAVCALFGAILVLGGIKLILGV